MIEIDRVSRRFGGNEAVKDLSLKIEPGEWFLMAGPNGAGKTTTLRLLMGILDPDQGACRVCGHLSSEDPMAVRRATGYLPERFYPYEYLTAREYLLFVARAYGLSRKEGRRRVGEVLDLVNLTEQEADVVSKGHSFGMTKKMAFGAAILHQPRVLLLDEPTAGLDPHGARRIYDVIGEFVKRGASCLMSSHLLLEVQDICDRVGFINDGQLIDELSLEQLKHLDPPLTLPEYFLNLVGWPAKPDMVGFFEGSESS